MTGLAILIPAALVLGALGLAGFLWAIRSGQFDDLEGAAMRILTDDDGSAAAEEQGQGQAGNGPARSECEASGQESQRRDEARDRDP